jgi:hypothetical protein
VILRQQKLSKNKNRNLAADDSEYWGRIIPGDLKDRAVNEVVGEEMVLGKGNASRREHLELNRLWPSA